MGRRGTNAGPPRVALALGLCALLTLLAPLLLAREPPRIDAQELARVVDRQNRTIVRLQEQLRRPAAPPPRRADASREPQRAPPPPPRRVDREPQHPAPAPGRNDAWRPVEITKDDWVVYLRAQKTGSQTLWTTLLDVFDGGAWGPRRCVRGPFCGHRCENVLRDAFAAASKQRKCHLFVRAHANLYDYQRAFESVNRNGRVHYLAFLRDPVKRALSEHDHITNGLVAQFGPHVFGKAWDYDFTDRTRASLSDWLMCTACRVGASNRQARFLAGLATTGELADGEGTAAGDARLYDAAARNLRACVFVGVLDRFEESMLLLKETFPGPLRNFRSFADAPHPKLGRRRAPDAAALARLRELNAVDQRLYDEAKVLFDARFASMLAATATSQRFRKRGGRYVLS